MEFLTGAGQRRQGFEKIVKNFGFRKCSSEKWVVMMQNYGDLGFKYLNVFHGVDFGGGGGLSLIHQYYSHYFKKYDNQLHHDRDRISFPIFTR